MERAFTENEPVPSSYDEVPYPSHPYPQSHPNNLSTIARLFGMKPAPVDRCRVLEIGCAAGGNIVPMADCFPQSEFVGIDLSRVQLTEGQRLIDKVGLTNVKLRLTSIADLTEDFGKFDYIVCHGVYSWVSSTLQDKILESCRELLQPQGIAYVSYNTYPGWHLRGICRAMMSYHSSRYQEPMTRVAQARALLDFMAESIPDQDAAYSTLLRRELDLLRGQSDSYLYHDHLEDVNEPIYFHEFAQRAREHRLQYLGESRLGIMSIDEFPPHVQKTLKLLATDIIQMEQYMDFLRNRAFRQTLICHDNVNLSRSVDWNRVRGLYAAAEVQAQNTTPDLSPGKPETFTDSSKRTASSDHPTIKAALLTLSEFWPRPVLFEELARLCSERLRAVGIQDGQGGQALGEMLLQGYTAGGVQLQTAPPSFVTSISNYPVAAGLARAQSESNSVITNRRHHLVQLDAIDSTILRLLDGSHDIDALATELERAFTKGTLSPPRQGNPEQVHTECAKLVQTSLQRLARNALLVA